MAKPIRILIDAVVEAEMYIPTWRRRTQEERARELEQAVTEFHDFLRDHRSIDRISLSVNRVFETQCSSCHEKWEVDTEDASEPRCAWCGEAVSG